MMSFTYSYCWEASSHHLLSHDEVIVLLEAMLEVNCFDAMSVISKGPLVTLSLLSELYEQHLTMNETVFAMCTYLFHIVGCIIVVKKSSPCVFVCCCYFRIYNMQLICMSCCFLVFQVPTIKQGQRHHMLVQHIYDRYKMYTLFFVVSLSFYFYDIFMYNVFCVDIVVYINTFRLSIVG